MLSESKKHPIQVNENVVKSSGELRILRKEERDWRNLEKQDIHMYVRNWLKW